MQGCHRLGSGGQATVYLGARLGRHSTTVCAIKVTKYRDTKSSDYARALDEAKRMADASGHPNVLKFYAYGELVLQVFLSFLRSHCKGDLSAEGKIYTVMEYVHGANLSEWKAYWRPVFGNSLICHIARETLSGLDFLHTRAKLIHRDISLYNIMMDSWFRVKIIDFGFSVDVGDRQCHGAFLTLQSTRYTTDTGYSGVLQLCRPGVFL